MCWGEKREALGEGGECSGRATKRSVISHDARDSIPISRLFEISPFKNLLIPEASLVSNGYCLADPDREQILFMAMGVNDEYDSGNGGAVTIKLSGESGTWSGFWFDPRDGDKTIISDLSGGSNHSLTPPSDDDWILLLTKK